MHDQSRGARFEPKLSQICHQMGQINPEVYEFSVLKKVPEMPQNLSHIWHPWSSPGCLVYLGGVELPARMSGLARKWVKLAPNGTNPGLFEIRFQQMYWNLIWKSRICPIWGQSEPLWSQTYHPWVWVHPITMTWSGLHNFGDLTSYIYSPGYESSNTIVR